MISSSPSAVPYKRAVLGSPSPPSAAAVERVGGFRSRSVTYRNMNSVIEQNVMDMTAEHSQLDWMSLAGFIVGRI